MPRERRRLAAIVSADVAGYSRLMGRDESGTLAALKVHRRELVDPSVAEHGKSTGDGLLLEFSSVVMPSAAPLLRHVSERWEVVRAIASAGLK